MSTSSKRLTTVLIILFTIALAIGAILLRKHRTAQVESLDKIQLAPWALHTVEIKKGYLSREFLALATLNGSTEITISSQISGEIKSMGPREGLKVNKGDLLVKISVSEFIEQREGLKAQLQAAVADLSRTNDESMRQKQLIKKHLTSQELYESKKTAALAAQKQVNNLQRQVAALNVRIGYGTIYASADALVAARLSEPGDIAMPGKKLYELTIDSASRLQVKLPQQVLEQVHPGTEVLLSYGTQQQKIKLSRIFPALDSHALGTAESDLNSMPFNLPSGARIPARIILESVDNALTISHQAIVETQFAMPDDLQKLKQGFVFKVVPGKNSSSKNKLKRVNVTIDLNAHRALAISSDDLHEGDQLVIAHESVLLQLQNNDPVIVDQIKVDQRKIDQKNSNSGEY